MLFQKPKSECFYKQICYESAGSNAKLALICRDVRMEVSRMEDFSRTLRGWVQDFPNLLIHDVRGTVIRLTENNLQFPVTGSNDLLMLVGTHTRKD